MVWLFWLYVSTGALLIAISVPLLLNKVPPNPLYGVRLKATLDDPVVWYATNRHSAWRMMAAGAATIGAAIGLRFVPGLSLDAYALLCLAVFFVVFLVGLVQTIRFMNALSRERQAGSPS